MTEPGESADAGGAEAAPALELKALKRALLGEDELDESELSRVSGVTAETVRRLWRAMGFPDADAGSTTFTQADAKALREVSKLLASRGEQRVVESARVLSSLLARAADVVSTGLSADLENDRLTGTLGESPTEAVQLRVRELSALLDYLFRRQLLTELARQITVEAGSLDVSGSRPLAVVFVDLVGFTRLSGQMEEDELAALVSKFQGIAFDAVAASGARVVKTLGDEVMVVSDDMDVALSLGATLARSYADDPALPAARVGIAYGPVLGVQGDFFGPTVNLASRLVGIAPPGVVLISEDARLALGPKSHVKLSKFGPRRLKGIGWTMAWVAEPPIDNRADQSHSALEDFYAALLDDDAEELYERAPCGYLSTSPDGTIIKVNQTFLTWTGYQREDLVGRRRFVDLLTGGGRIYHETHYAPMLATQGAARQIALDLVGEDGRRRIPCLVNAVMENAPTGEPIVIRVAVFDATERREYERELLRAKQRAEESERRATLLAQTLQQTLIPPALPAIPGVDVAAVYRPAGYGDQVGGDFYDVFEVAEDDWVVVIGDVCGKGVEAAVVTALARYTIRAAAARLSSPSDVLEVLNDALLRHGSSRFCTVASASLRKTADQWQLKVCMGGHPPPLLVRAATAVPVGEYGTLLGVVAAPPLHDHQVALHSGDQIVFFTDGVTEARRGGDFYGDERLVTSALGHASAEAAAGRILQDVLDFQEGVSADDIAIVVVHIP